MSEQAQPDNLSNKNKNRIILKFVLFLMVMVGAGLAVYYSDLHQVFLNRERLIEFVSSFRHAAVVFIGIQVAQILVAPIPGEMTGFVGGYLFGGMLGFLYSTIGLTVGSAIAFMLSRLFGRPMLEKIASRKTLEKYDFLMEHRGLWISFFLFLIPGFPKDLFCYILGTSHMSFGAFLAISTLGRLFGTVLLSISGSLVRGGDYKLLGGVIVFVACAALVSYLYRQSFIDWLKAKRHQHKPGGKF